MLKNIKFETSVFSVDKIIQSDKKQIALAGKSNVGKSSFINAISSNSKLAKVGNTPGKTRSLNYYNVNDEFYIVDLPGYGYSTMSRDEKIKVGEFVEHYLSSGMISHIFLILDIRHKPTQDDRDMYDFLSESGIPFTIIASKADKIGKSQIDENIKQITKTLFAKEQVIPFSSESKLNVDSVKDLIENITM